MYNYCYTDAPRERATTLTDAVVCWDAATGKELWKKEFDATSGGRPAGMYGAAGTPAVWGGKCYIAGIKGIYCFSAKDGALLWRQEQGGNVNASVLIANGVVVGGWPVAGYDAESGKLLWKSNADKASGHISSSPVLWSSGGKNYLIVAGRWALTMCCLEIETGKIVWEVKGPNIDQPTPVVSGDTMVVGLGGATAAYKLTPEKAEFLWKSPIADGASSPIVYQDNVYISRSYYVSDTWYCLDLKTGATKWKQQVDVGFRCSSPILADGKIIMPSGNAHSDDISGTIEMLKATPEKYVNLGMFNPKMALCSSPAIVDGRLYLRLWDGVACYDLRTK
jgi:outer membrane protein assembly factor BamB